MKALISVSDKNGIKEFAKNLHSLGYEIISTGGTYNTLKTLNIGVKEVSEITEFNEILDGRVKTLHPKIHGAILHKRDNKKHLEEIKKNDIGSIDLICVNLYPFKETIEKTNDEDEIIENIDIGGPTLIRASAKNFQDCIIVTDINDYQNVIDAIKNKKDDLNFRKNLMIKAFEHTANYDKVIFNHMSNNNEFSLQGKKVFDTRYGENPHQSASLYAFDNFFDNFNIIKGELSFNNLLDINACLRISSLFENQKTITIVKHGNACGFAIDDNLVECFKKALICDPISAYGGVACINSKVDENLAKELNSIFLEVVIAPSFTQDAIDLLSGKKRIKLVALEHYDDKLPTLNNKYDVKVIEGGFLVQQRDEIKKDEIKNATLKSKKEANSQERQDMQIAYKIASCTKSNCIVYVKDSILVAIGMGMTSRVDAAKSALAKAKDLNVDISGCAMASEAFFPFRDSIDAASEAGVTTIIQPGGSIRDDDVIKSANEHNIALYFTGTRHFLH